MNTYGTLLDEQTVRFERVLPGPIERVWAYITEPDKRASWLCGGDYELQPEGSVEMVFNNARLSGPDDCEPLEKYRAVSGEVRMSGKVLRCEPPTLLEHTWVFGDEDSIVRYELEADGKAVRLVLTHSRLATPDQVLSVCGGWHTHFAVLEAILDDAATPPFWKTLIPLEREYASRLGLD